VVDVEAPYRVFIPEFSVRAPTLYQAALWCSDRGKLLDALDGRIDLIEVLIYAYRQRAPTPADERRDMPVLVHPEPVELESHEPVSPRHFHCTDATATTHEPANRK
jgi:hypothetical protein